MAKQDSQDPIRRRKRRPKGVSKGLTIGLIVLALVLGGGLGYIMGGNSQGDKVVEKDVQIANATQRILDLEAALEVAGIDPNADVFDGLAKKADPDVVSALVGDDEPISNNNVLLDDTEKLDSNAAPASTVEPTVVAEFGDVKIMSDEVLDSYNASVNEMMFRGQDVSEFADTLMEESLTTLITQKLKSSKAAELNLTDLTEEDEKAIDEQAQTDFEALVAFYSTDEDGMTDEEVRQEAIKYVEEEEGITLESLRKALEETWWEQKLSDYVTKDVSVTEEQLQETYDQFLTDQQALYAESLDEYEFAKRYGEETVVYNPEGYRTFKQVLIAFTDEDSYRVEEIMNQIETLDAAADVEQIDALNAELETLYAKLQATADEVLDRVAQGDDFDKLIEEYGQDPEQNEENVKQDGYYVCADSATYSPVITQAAMALEKPGSVSEAVRSVAGLHIMKYNTDVPAGPIAMETVRESLTDEALESLKYDVYDEQIANWVEEAGIVYHREALQ